MPASVRFRQAAIEDIAHYEAWRARQERDLTPIGDVLVDAIVRAIRRFDSFSAIPAPLLAVHGQPAAVKRLLVPVRSKVFRVYVGPGRLSGVITVRRVRHPSQRPIERS